MNIRSALICMAIVIDCAIHAAAGAEPMAVLNLWPAKPPGDTQELEPERDMTKPGDQLIAGRAVIRLGNVSTPTLSVYRPSADNTGAAFIICPGGGHRILAWDLEGTEVAQWLNSIGVTAAVLKYRVPFRNPERRFEAAVQDAQRAISLVRGKAGEWQIDPQRIGILGFSAGGETAALSAIFTDRQYAAVDKADEISCRPDFAALIYPGGLLTPGNDALRDYVKVTQQTPPMFFAHAHDDRVSPLNSVLLYAELKKAGVPAELHVYAHGGHGYGLRKTEQPVTWWSERFEAWAKASGLLQAKGIN